MKKQLLLGLLLFITIGCNGKPTSTVFVTTTNQSISSSYVDSTSTSFISATSSTPSETTSSSSKSDEIEFEKSYLELTGFAKSMITSRKGLENSNSYRKVKDEIEFIQAVGDKKTKIIEITNDLNLGYYEVEKMFQDKGIDLSPYTSNVFLKPNQALTHPILKQTGVGRINIQDRNLSNKNPSLMIYSKNGASISHAIFTIKRSEDIVIRNLSFKDIWEWDEKNKGDYDTNDWDHITVEESNGVYLDHLTFEKSYDGLVDIKKGTSNVTISWCKFIFEETTFLRAQFDYLEENRSTHPMYNFLRKSGLSKEEIIEMNIGQKKGHLVGATEFNAVDVNLSLTLHHNYYKNLQDRLPRLRAGNVHVYNVILDSSELYKIKKNIEKNYPELASNAAKNGYKIGITSQGIVTTENGAVYMEDSVFKGVSEPIKNNQVNGTKSEYTGKYLVLNSVYQLESYYFIGDSEDDNTPFKAKQAPIISFSFNLISKLPYFYQKHSVLLLEQILLEKYLGCNSVINIDYLDM